MNDRERIFEIWAPPGGLWSPWVKPVLFAEIFQQSLPTTPQPPPAPADPRRPEPHPAYVIDLPGPGALEEWARLAPQGYRPVPLYNAAPGPRGTWSPPVPGLPGEPGSCRIAMVDAWSIAEAILEKTPLLESLDLPLESPPAFLLDASRRTGLGPAAPGRFDNRSISFPTDFPSASFLLSRRYDRVILIQENSSQPQPDLAHTLRRWQEAGIAILLQAQDRQGPPEPIDIQLPSRFKSLWYGFLTRLGLRRHPLGGFGGLVPHPSSG